MDNEEFLKSKESILVIEKRRKTSIVIGAPHHAPGGVIENRFCKEHPATDENTGYIARRVAEIIDASSIIACCYHVDSNKSLGTDYSIQIAKWRPKFLIEIHGHGAKGLGRNGYNKKGIDAENGIEISSGSKNNDEISIKFAEVLQEKLSTNMELNNFSVCGHYDRINFRASNTATITSGNWKAIHIELPPKLRIDSDQLPKFINDFINKLAETILELCI